MLYGAGTVNLTPCVRRLVCSSAACAAPVVVPLRGVHDGSNPDCRRRPYYRMGPPTRGDPDGAPGGGARLLGCGGHGRGASGSPRRGPPRYWPHRATGWPPRRVRYPTLWSTPVIYLSGSDPAQLGLLEFPEALWCYLAKPIDWHQLHDILAQLFPSPLAGEDMPHPRHRSRLAWTTPALREQLRNLRQPVGAF